MALMYVTINYLGPSLSVYQLDDLLTTPTSSPQLQSQATLIEKFFGLPLKTLPREVLDRYCET